MGDGNNIPVGPQGPPPGGVPNGGTNPGSNTGTNTGSNSGSRGNNSNGGGNPYLAAQRKAQRKAAQKYKDQARMLQQQIDALLDSLGGRGGGAFKRALEVKLSNIDLVYGQQDKKLLRDYRERYGELKESVGDNDKAAADQSYAALTNRGRERANAVSEAMLQGAGESDLLRSQGMALRSWDANQSEIQRSKADTLRSINSALTDLNIDTSTGRTNLLTEANADREGLWTNYFGQRSEAYTMLGNAYGEQAVNYASALEMVGSKKTRKQMKRAEELSGDAFDAQTRAIGRAWKNPGIPAHLRRWDGRDAFENTGNNAAIYENAATNVALDKPDGATLREWTA